jgi:DNA polymerase-3 subunit alpha
VIVYQDQVLKIAQKFAGYTLGAADIMRKAMGKKIAAMMLAEKERFISGAIAKGYSQEDAENVFALIEPFAGYAFNKAHSYSYGTIAYQTAWLKANYPVEYLTAVLMQAPSHPAGALERIAQAYNECVRLGIELLPPDVNKSGANFVIEETPDGKTAIRFGLGMIKNVGSGAAEAIVEARTANGGSFATLNDFCRTLNTRNVNKRAVESLIKAGALDSVAGRTEARGSMLINLDRIVSIAQSSQKLRETGQTTMFDLFGEEVATPLAGIDLESAPIPLAEVLAWEKELLGIWLSEHPYTRAAAELAGYVTALCNEFTPELLADLPPQGRDFVIAGIVGSTRRLTTRDGRGFIAAEITDLAGTVEITVWPDIYERTADYWTTGRIVLVQVRVRERGDRVSAGVQEVVTYDGDGFIPPSWALLAASEQGTRRASAVGEPRPAQPEADTLGTKPLPPAKDLYATLPDQDAPFDLDSPPPLGIAEAGEPYEPPRPAIEVMSREANRTVFSLVLVETDDEDADQKRLAVVFRLLQDHPGNDDVRLTIRTRYDETIDLALPSAQLDDALRRELEAAIGVEAALPA